MDRIVDLSNRYKLRFTGPQALWFLDQLITNQVVDLPPGAAKQALLLTPKGRITADLSVLSIEGGALVTVDAEDPAAVFQFFSNRIFATKVKIEEADELYGIVRILGAEARSWIDKFEAPDLPAGGNDVPIDPLELGDLEDPLEGVDLWFPCGAKDYIFRTMADQGVQELSGDAYEGYRVTKGVPRFGVDFDASYLPQEAALERAVHFKKGCYLGQEAVAMTQRGRVRRRVRRVEVDGDSVLGELWSPEARAGVITSIAGGVGIATVDARIAPGTELELRSDGRPVGRARVEVLPGTVEGPSVPSARELRERLQRGS